METYKRWIDHSIIMPLKNIKDPIERINFILERKMEFVANNRNSEVPMVVQVIDTLIDKERFAMQVNIANQKNNEKSNQTNIESEELLDFAKNSVAERIVIMKELGILDYLENKMIQESVVFSANKLAGLLSSFTNVSQKTLQSYLNPIISKGVSDRNNPLTDANIQKAQLKLLKIGFKIK